MIFLQRSCLLAATLLLLVTPFSGGQQTNSLSRSGQDSNHTADQRSQQESEAYQCGYQQGLEDRADADQPSPGYVYWKNAGAAYRDGYRAGYCHNEKVGYYSGTYGYGPPVLRNGYYGYNAPNPYCENNSGNAAFYRGDAKAPQNQVEYGGGG